MQEPIVIVRVGEAPAADLFFETSWGDGPFTAADLDRICATDPRRAHQFHLAGYGITYAAWKATAGPADGRG